MQLWLNNVLFGLKTNAYNNSTCQIKHMNFKGEPYTKAISLIPAFSVSGLILQDVLGESLNLFNFNFL